MYACVRCVCSPANMIAQSQSGTGKTAAFVLTMLSRVVRTNEWPQVGVSRAQYFVIFFRQLLVFTRAGTNYKFVYMGQM